MATKNTGTTRFLTLPTVPIADGGSTRVRLPAAEPIISIHALVKMAFTSSAAAPVPHEDGASAQFSKVTLAPSGTAQIYAGITGPMCRAIAAYDRGGQLPAAIDHLSPVNGGAGTSAFLLTLPLTAPNTAAPTGWGFDPRGLQEIELTLDARTVDSLIGTTTESAVSGTVKVGMVTSLDEPPLTGSIWERRFVSAIRTLSAGPIDSIPLKRAAFLRRIYLIARNAAPLAGVRSDAVVDSLRIVRDNNDIIVQDIDWLMIRGLTAETRDVDLGVGIGVIDMDVLSMTGLASMIDADDVASLSLEGDGLAAGNLEIVAEYAAVRR